MSDPSAVLVTQVCLPKQETVPIHALFFARHPHSSFLRATVRILPEKGAQPRPARRLEVIKMHPKVGRVLDAALDGQRLMMRLRLARQEVRIQDARPQDRPPQLWLHDESQIVELRAASRLNVREVDEEGVDAHALWRPMGGLLVVVHLVELATAYGKQQGRR